MKIIMSGFLDDAYMTFLRSPVNCCSPMREQHAPMRDVEKPMRIEHHQPRLVPSPIPEPQDGQTMRGREWVTKSRELATRASSRGSFAVRRQLNAYNGFHSRRPQIGAPSDFRHVEHAFPQRPPAFRPLELSIYMPENQLSPILPHFGNIDDMSYGPTEKELPFPPAVMTHERSESASSHRIPRKPVRSGSQISNTDWSTNWKARPDYLSAQQLLESLENDLPQAPPQARLRAMTEPPSYERVKSALHEKHLLEQRLRDIEETIEERKSIYLNSRPVSRAMSRSPSIYAETNEPMPTPPIAPSFAERVASPHLDQRPKTAPSKTVHIPARLKSFTEASATFNTPSPPSSSKFSSTSFSASSHHQNSYPMPPPPLPLVLKAAPNRPPLRKKKSFSGKVSTWLFPTSHSRDTSLESVTNTPKPVTLRDGFYQCIDLSQQAGPRPSFSSATTVSTLETEQFEQPSPPTTWSPHSSPGREKVERQPVIRTFSMDSDRDDQNDSVDLTKVTTFGENRVENEPQWRMLQGDNLSVQQVYVPGRNSVGVAF